MNCLELHECKPISTSWKDKVTVKDVLHVSFCCKKGRMKKETKLNPQLSFAHVFNKCYVLIFGVHWPASAVTFLWRTLWLCVSCSLHIWAAAWSVEQIRTFSLTENVFMPFKVHKSSNTGIACTYVKMPIQSIFSDWDWIISFVQKKTRIISL